MIDNDIRTYLLTQSPISTLVGTDAAGAMARIYQNEKQQGVTAASIVYQLVATDHEHTLGAALGYATGIFEFDCIGTSLSSAKALGLALRGELDGFIGTMGSTTVKWVEMQDEHDEYDPPADGSQKGLFHVIQTYGIAYLESVPTF